MALKPKKELLNGGSETLDKKEVSNNNEKERVRFSVMNTHDNPLSPQVVVAPNILWTVFGKSTRVIKQHHSQGSPNHIRILLHLGGKCHQ